MKQRLLLKMIFLLLFCYGAAAQDKKISGKVTDSDGGGPLPGVSVKDFFWEKETVK